MDQQKVTSVRGEVLYKVTRASRAAGLPPTITGYRYTAVLEDGSEEVIRAKTTGRYDWTHQWAAQVASRGHMRGLSAYFTFSSERRSPETVLPEFRIEWL